MSSKFKKGQEVKVMSVIPQGTVESIRMDDDGEVYYLMTWTNYNGVSQTRWFNESELEMVSG